MSLRGFPGLQTLLLGGWGLFTQYHLRCSPRLPAESPPLGTWCLCLCRLECLSTSPSCRLPLILQTSLKCPSPVRPPLAPGRVSTSYSVGRSPVCLHCSPPHCSLKLSVGGLMLRWDRGWHGWVTGLYLWSASQKRWLGPESHLMKQLRAQINGDLRALAEWDVCFPNIPSSVTCGAPKRQETCAAAAPALSSQIPHLPSAAPPIFQEVW